MAETGQLAARVGREKGFEIREYPVPAFGAGVTTASAGQPLREGDRVFRQQEDGHITRGAIAPN